MFKNFLIDLDQILQENVDIYMDEDGNPIEHNITEQDVYNWIMAKEEYHFLTTERVKNIIHKFMTDFKWRMEILECFKAL